MREGWTYKKLGEVCETCSGGTPAKSHPEYYEGGTIPWLRSGEVSQGLIFKTELCITENGLKNSSAKIVPIDTVSITMYGATIGEVGIIKAPMCTNQAICNVLPNSEIVPAFLRYYLMGQKVKYISMAAGGAQPNISQDLIRRTLLPIIPKSQQEAIVSELDEINSLLALKREQLQKYDKLAQSLFYEMFGDPVENEKGWEVKKWKDVLSIINGKNQREVECENGAYPICGSGGIMGRANSYLCPSYCTIIGRKGNINKPIFMKEPFWNVDTAFGLNADGSVLNPYYLFYFCKDFNFEYLNKAVTIPSLTKADLLQVSIPLPPLPLQQQFASRIEQIEEQKKQVTAAIERLETLLASRMQYWFE